MGKPPRTVEQCREYAESRGGKLLSTTYINENQKMQWQCGTGHLWMATAASTVRAKSWCPHCAHIAAGRQKRKTLDDCRSLANIRGGVCVSRKYVNSKSKLKWKCACGNKWNATYNTVHNGHWCSKCANLRKRRANHLGIEKMHKLAAQRHGKCLSQHYANVNCILDWECAEGHRFPGRVSNVIAGSWCPTCTAGLSGAGLSEHLCRLIFEHLYGSAFPRRRLDWLRSESGARMELDGYNEDEAIAFEYQGVQHYKPVIKFKSDHLRLAKLQNRDELKARACKLKNIALVVVPYTVGQRQLESFIRNELRRLGKSLPTWDLLPQLDLWLPAVRVDARLTHAKQRGLALGMTCLSSTYLFHDTHLQWRCQTCGHEFPFRPDRLDKVHVPCKKCREVAVAKAHQQNMLRKIHAILNAQGGKLLTYSGKGQRTSLKIKCNRGHSWQTSWGSLRQGTKCPECRMQH